MESPKRLRSLLVDDDPEFAADFAALVPEWIQLAVAGTPAETLAALREADVELVFLDVDLGSGKNGLDLLEEIKREWPYVPIVMVTADRDTDTVVQALRLGASDYIGKQPDLRQLKLLVLRSLEQCRLRRHLDLVQTELSERFGDLIGESEPMRKVKEDMSRLAGVSSNVLITGPSGTGKELVARGIHQSSDRRKSPFIAVNCAALSRELIESELFGHERGSFTNAVARRIGKFEAAGNGTLLLDEITEIPIGLQAKLLRVLQEREFERVGGNRLIGFAARVLAASNRDPEQAIRAGLLRDDLFYRLNVARIALPPLAERKSDIPLLVHHFIRAKTVELKRQQVEITDEAVRALCAYHWPGNVRELANVVENALVHCDDGPLQAYHFSQCLPAEQPAFANYEDAKRHYLARFQREYISVLLRRNDGNVSQTARDMGVSRQGLIKMMESCGLS